MQNYTIMNQLEHKRIERTFKLFVDRHFVSPKKCKNIQEIQFYIKELTEQISHFNNNFNYVPNDAYTLLAEYNFIQNQQIYDNFKANYSYS